MHIESLGTAQPTVRLNRAQGYWNAHHDKGRHLTDEMPEIVQERLRGPNLQAPTTGNTFTPISQINSMDQLVSEFKKMTAHITDMDNRIKTRQEYRPAKYFATKDKRTPSMPCSNCGGAHWKNEC